MLADFLQITTPDMTPEAKAAAIITKSKTKENPGNSGQIKEYGIPEKEFLAKVDMLGESL